MKFALILSLFNLFAGSVFAAEQLYSEKPSRTPELAKPGKYVVGVTTQNLINPKQLSTKDFQSLEDRKLTVEIWYPAAEASDSKTTYEGITRLHQPFSLAANAYRDAKVNQAGDFPLIVLSHGYTGYRTIMFYLGEHLASHGYVVVGIDHTDSTTAEIDFKKAPFAGFGSTLINRARDQQFVLEHMAKSEDELAKITDANRASVIGFSMGGYGAINTVGGCYSHTSAGLQRLGYPKEHAEALTPIFNFCNAGLEKVDHRWKAMVAIAPWGQELGLHSPESLSKINVPTLWVSGEYDDVSGYENGVKKLFEQTSPKDNYLLVYRDARHNVAPHPAPQVAYAEDADLGHYEEPNWDMEVLNLYNQHFVLAFTDCYVKSSQSACDMLPTRENSNQVKGNDGKLSEPWPGIPDRWGTGMYFYRGK